MSEPSSGAVRAASLLLAGGVLGGTFLVIRSCAHLISGDEAWAHSHYLLHAGDEVSDLDGGNDSYTVILYPEAAERGIRIEDSGGVNRVVVIAESMSGADVTYQWEGGDAFIDIRASGLEPLRITLVNARAWHPLSVISRARLTGIENGEVRFEPLGTELLADRLARPTPAPEATEAAALFTEQTELRPFQAYAYANAADTPALSMMLPAALLVGTMSARALYFLQRVKDAGREP